MSPEFIVSVDRKHVRRLRALVHTIDGAKISKIKEEERAPWGSVELPNKVRVVFDELPESTSVQSLRYWTNHSSSPPSWVKFMESLNIFDRLVVTAALGLRPEQIFTVGQLRELKFADERFDTHFGIEALQFYEAAFLSKE